MKRTYSITFAVLLTASLALAERNISSPLETGVKKLPAAKAIQVPAAQVSQMKKIESKKWTVPGLDLKMVRVPAGTFLMGSPKTEDARRDDETQHKVTISKPFYMGVYEVTQRQYYRLLKPDFDFDQWGHWRGAVHQGMASEFRSVVIGMGCEGSELLLDHPMECVSFVDALTFCNAINSREKKASRLPKGYAYRLPTEAEWEYACRAGSKGLFAMGNEKTIIKEGALAKTKQSAQRELRTFASWPLNTPVGRGRKANAWGLVDMHGNVAEWVLDSYAPYRAGKATDPLVADASLEKVIRGGSHAAGYEFMRSAARYHIPFDIDYYRFVGIRLVLAPEVTFPLPARPAKPKPTENKKK